MTRVKDINMATSQSQSLIDIDQHESKKRLLKGWYKTNNEIDM